MADDWQLQRLAHSSSTCTTECGALSWIHQWTIMTNKVVKSENLGAFYKYINKRTSYRPAIGALTDDGGNIKTDDYDKVELFNSYFATVGGVDNGKIPVGQSHCSLCASSIETVEFDERSIASAIYRQAETKSLFRAR